MDFPALTKPTAPWCHLFVGSAADLYDIATALDRSGKGVIARIVRGKKAATTAALHEEFAAALQFPPHYGENWDALRDCLLDLGWLGATQLTVAVVDADQFLDRAPAKQWAHFATVVSEALRYWNEAAGVRQATPFHWVMQTDAKSAEALATRWREAGLTLARLK